MTKQEKAAGDLWAMTRAMMDVGAKNMEIAQEQFAKNLDATMTNAKAMQEKTQEALAGLMDQATKMRQSYVEAVDEGMGMLGKQIKNA